MTTELLAAICAAPDDDAPRLVYADWLLERGDRRGELINAQCTRRVCEAAGDFTSDHYRTALVTESLTLREVRKPWLIALGSEDMVNIAFVRGFPNAAGGEPEQLFSRWSALRELPLEMLIFPQTPARPVTVGDLRRWADLPPIATLTTIAIMTPGATAHLDAARVRDALTDASDATPLFPEDALAPIAPFHECTVALGHGESSDGGRVLAFDDHTALPTSLRALTLSCDGVSEHDLFPNIRTNAKRLETLGLGEARTDHALAALWDWPHPHLHKLRLDAERGPFPLDVGRRFAISGAAKTLRHLEAAFPLDDLVASSLASSPLSTLNLNGGGDAAALEQLLRHHPKLHELTLARFTGDVAGALERAAPAQLSVLTLRDMPTLDLGRLARWQQRLASLTLVGWTDASELLRAPALASTPWLHTGQGGNRLPAPNALRYRGDVWP